MIYLLRSVYIVFSPSLLILSIFFSVTNKRFVESLQSFENTKTTLFYPADLRKQTLNNPNEEMQQIKLNKSIEEFPSVNG